MNAPEPCGPDLERRSPSFWNTEQTITAPLGAASSGRLIFTSAVAGVTLLADPDLPGLLRGDFSRNLSWIGMEAGVVALGYRRNPAETPPPAQPGQGSLPGQGETIRLNAGLPWALEFHSQVFALEARLCGLELRSLDVLGPAASLLLELSQPVDRTCVYLAGPASLVTLRRPPQVGVSIHVQHSLEGLTLDGRPSPQLGPGDRIETPGFEQAAQRIEISLAGPARQWRID